MNAQREAIAAAASSVEGINVTPHVRQVSKPGEGFVRFDVQRRDETGFGWMATWQVCVLLNQDHRVAQEWVDDHLDDLLDALLEQGNPTDARPVRLALDTGTIPALVVNLTAPKE